MLLSLLTAIIMIHGVAVRELHAPKRMAKERHRTPPQLRACQGDALPARGGVSLSAGGGECLPAKRLQPEVQSPILNMEVKTGPILRLESLLFSSSLFVSLSLSLSLPLSVSLFLAIHMCSERDRDGETERERERERERETQRERERELE